MNDTKEVKKYLFDFSEYLDKRISEKVKVRFGYESIDNISGGLFGGKVYIVGARTGKGKTALLTNIAYNNSSSGKILIFSTEIGVDEFIERLISLDSSIPVFDFRTKISSLYDDIILNKLESLEKLNLFVNDTPAPNLGSIFKVVSEVNPDLLIVDYLGQMFFKSNDNVPKEISELVRGLKIISRKYNIPVLVACQLNRNIEYRGGEPQLSDLKDSGGIEETADMVMFISELRDDSIDFIIAKSRYCDKGRGTLLFDRNTLKIRNEPSEIEWKE